MITLGVLRLSLAIANRLKTVEDRDAMIKLLASAISDDGKVSPIEWATMGKRLGVFDIK